MKKDNSLEPGQRRSESVRFRVTPWQKEHIQQLADKCGMNVSEFVLARAFNYEPKVRITEIEQSVCQELILARTDYKRYISMLEGMDGEVRRRMFNREVWMSGALRHLDAQRKRIDAIINTVFSKNHLPPRTSNELKTKNEE
jgi:uncharacterized protein (DUF1778 family)